MRKKCKVEEQRRRKRGGEPVCRDSERTEELEIKTNLKPRHPTRVGTVGVSNLHTRCESSEKGLRTRERKDERKAERCLRSSIYAGLLTICECAHFLRSSPGRHLMVQ